MLCTFLVEIYEVWGDAMRRKMMTGKMVRMVWELMMVFVMMLTEEDSGDGTGDGDAMEEHGGIGNDVELLMMVFVLMDEEDLVMGLMMKMLLRMT